MGSCSGTEAKVKDFRLPMPYKDEMELFGSIDQLEVLEHISLDFSVLSGCLSGSQQTMDSVLSEWTTRRQEHNHPNLLVVHEIISSESTKLFIPSLTVTLIFDLPIENLSRNKKIIQKHPLPEPDIWNVLDCVIAGYAFMQENKIYPQCIGPEDILLVATPFGEKIYKVIDRYFKSNKISYFQQLVSLDKEDPRFLDLKKIALLSPSQIEALPSRNKYLKQNRYKADVFILGCILIQFAIGKKLDFYDWRSWHAEPKNIKDAIDLLAKLGYNDLLRKIFEKMLTIEEANRPDYIELNDMIANAYATQKTQRLLEKYDESEFYLYGSQEQSRIKKQSTAPKEMVIATKNVLPENSFLGTQDDPNTIQTGTLKYSNGYYYIGSILNKQKHGQGVFYDKQHHKIIEGQWLHDKPDGEVSIYNIAQTEEFPSHKFLDRSDWIQFKGYVRQGQREGQGVLFFQDGAKYIGQFFGDKAHGRGVYEYANKETIVGNWQYDQYIS